MVDDTARIDGNNISFQLLGKGARYRISNRRISGSFRGLSEGPLDNRCGHRGQKEWQDISLQADDQEIDGKGCESSFINFTFIPILSYKAKDIEQYPKKLYCIDTGMIRSVKSPRRQDMGSTAENIVAMELLRRYPKENIYYWKGRGEVDFVVVDGDEKQLIQVCWDMKDSGTGKREIKALMEAEEELGSSSKLILSMEGTEMEEGIENSSLWMWLLGGCGKGP